MRRGATAAALLLLATCGPHDQPPDIAVEQAWARGTVPGQTSGAAYFTILNRGRGDDRLVEASSPAAGAASLHSSSSAGGVARMRPIEDGVMIAGGRSVAFKPGGHHVMLRGLRRPLAAGTTALLRLRFERSGERQVELRIVDAAAAGAGPGHGGH